MFRSYLTITIRHLKRHRFHTLLNIIGLSIGVGCFLIAIIYADHQFSYNRQHENLDQIYRVVRQVTDSGGKRYDIGTRAVGPLLADTFPEIEDAVKVLNRQMFISAEDVGFNGKVAVATPNILKVFTYPLIKGDPNSLKRPGTAMLTEEYATKLFGSANPLGKIVKVDYKWFKGDLEITGILKNISPRANFKLRFDLLTSTYPEIGWRHLVWDAWPVNWFIGPLRNYLVFKPGTDVEAFQEKLHRFAAEHEIPDGREKIDLVLQHGPRMHLYTRQDFGVDQGGGHDQPSGDIDRVYAILAIGTLVLLLACLNYINIVTSQADLRSREVGLRKVSGATRGNLIVQFLGESILLTAIAFGIAITVAHYALPWVSSILDADLSFKQVSTTITVGLPLLIIPLIGLIAGCYPAVVMAKHQPVEALSAESSRPHGSRLLRRTLVTVQFCASTALIIGTVVIHDQIVYMQNKDLGFERERMIALPFFLKDRALWTQIDAIKSQITSVPNVESVTATHHRPGEATVDFMTVKPAGGPPDGYKLTWEGIDEDFLKTFDIELVHGQNITMNGRRQTGERQWEIDVLINQRAANLIGWKADVENALQGEWGATLIVKGVVKDYHNQSLHAGIAPMILYPSTTPKNIYVRLSTPNLPGTLEALERVWKQFLPDRPFEFEFLNDRFNNFYRAEMTLRQVFTFFSVLAIVVGCLGTLGLVTYSVRRRRKEMAIRRTLGADAWTVIYLLSREFLILIGTAFAVATPIVYYLCREWLNGFIYRIDLPVSAFFIGGMVTLILVALSIATQTLHASRENPIEALRHE